MGREQLGNGVVTTLSSGIDNSTTTVNISSSTGWPTGFFRVICDSEVMYCSSRSGTTLTVVRAQEGTAAAAHASGATIICGLTLGGLNQFFLDYAFRKEGDVVPNTPGTYDEEFDGAADTLPSNWSWTVAPSGSDAWTLNSTLKSGLLVEGNGNTTYMLTRSSFSPGAIDFGIWAKVSCGPHRAADTPNLTFKVGDSGDTAGRMMQLYASGAAAPQIRALRRTASADAVWESGSAATIGPGNTEVYLGLTRTSGDSWSAYYSTNGITWQQFGNAQSQSFTANKITFSLQTTSVQTRAALFWLRYRTDLLFPRPG